MNHVASLLVLAISLNTQTHTKPPVTRTLKCSNLHSNSKQSKSKHETFHFTLHQSKYLSFSNKSGSNLHDSTALLAQSSSVVHCTHVLISLTKSLTNSLSDFSLNILKILPINDFPG